MTEDSCPACGSERLVDEPDEDEFDAFDPEEPPWDYGCRDCGYAWSKGESPLNMRFEAMIEGEFKGCDDMERDDRWLRRHLKQMLDDAFARASFVDVSIEEKGDTGD